MHHAFVLQSLGKSTVAFFSFRDGFVQAMEAGENPAKLRAIEQLFMWYRYYGEGTNLFAIQPTGGDRIIGNPPALGFNNFSQGISKREVVGYTPFISISTPLLADIPDYRRFSSREVADLQREFIFSAGMVIAGMFLIPVVGQTYGVPLLFLGLDKAIDSGLKLYSDKKAHEEMLKAVSTIRVTGQQ